MYVAVKVDEDLSRALQELAFKLDWQWRANKQTVILEKPYLAMEPYSYHKNKIQHVSYNHNGVEITVPDFIEILKRNKTPNDFLYPHKIEIDGKTITLSEESYQNFVGSL